MADSSLSEAQFLILDVIFVQKVWEPFKVLMLLVWFCSLLARHTPAIYVTLGGGF